MADESFVKLNPGDTIMIRVDQATYHTRAVQDPVLKMSKDVKVLALHVIELAGQPANTIFSIMSDKLQKEFDPYIAGEKFLRYRFTITRGSGTWESPRIAAAVPV
jgi:hypothetical protein